LAKKRNWEIRPARAGLKLRNWKKEINRGASYGRSTMGMGINQRALKGAIPFIYIHPTVF